MESGDNGRTDRARKGHSRAVVYAGETHRSCQHLLAAASNLPPFTQEERAIIKYYMAEIEKTLHVTQRTMASRPDLSMPSHFTYYSPLGRYGSETT